MQPVGHENDGPYKSRSETENARHDIAGHEMQDMIIEHGIHGMQDMKIHDRTRKTESNNARN